MNDIKVKQLNNEGLSSLFKQVRERLNDGGIFICVVMKNLLEDREHDGFLDMNIIDKYTGYLLQMSRDFDLFIEDYQDATVSKCGWFFGAKERIDFLNKVIKKLEELDYEYNEKHYG